MDKKIFFIQLPVDFFDSDEMKILQRQPGGAELSIFYIKCLLSRARHEGYLIYNENIPFTDSMLAAATGCSIETVRTAVEWLRGFGLLEIQPGGVVFLPQRAQWTKYESPDAERKRRQRRRQKRLAAGSEEPTGRRIIAGAVHIKTVKQ